MNTLTRTAHHEAGHALMMLRWHDDFPLVKVVILASGGGEVHHRSPEGSTDPWGTVLVAGRVAETILGVCPERCKRASRRDRERAEKLLDRLGLVHPRQRVARLKSWERGAARLLRRRWPDVVRIAAALIVKRMLDATEVQQILGGV